MPRDEVLVSVKFGALRDPAGGWSGYDARPAAVKNFLAYSLQRLGVDHIDIYRPARLDPEVPIEETVGAIADMVKAGYVRHIGLSEVGAETIRRAAAVHPIVRSADRVFADLARHRGRDPADLPRARHRHHRLRRAVARADQRPLAARIAARASDFRAHSPRFQGENVDAQPRAGRGAAQGRRGEGRQRRADRDRLGGGAGRRHRAAGRRAPPRPPRRGARRARASRSSADDLAAIERAVPKDAAAGARYPAPQMANSRQRAAGRSGVSEQFPEQAKSAGTSPRFMPWVETSDACVSSPQPHFGASAK